MLRFLKLGGSLITDKNGVEAARLDVIKRAAHEIALGLADVPDTRLLIGHGSGSFGHVAANQYGTRQGVHDSEDWAGFAEVSVVAARLNALVAEALYAEHVPVMRFQPSASALCSSGHLGHMDVTPIRSALDAGLAPRVDGDVAFDRQIGGTIISTEEIFSFLAKALKPESIWLAGDVPGVMDNRQHLISEITTDNIGALHQALGESSGTDVTGGMVGKVETMLNLCSHVPGLSVHIFSGLEESLIRNAVGGLLDRGTVVHTG